ncbi:outer membrane beta-barrel protein [Candidatus Omnitrophota bacterium]
MSKKHTIFLASFLAFLLIVFSCLPVFAAEASGFITEDSPALLRFVKNLIKKIDFATSITTAYDSNIFLTEDAEDADMITTLTQKVSLELIEEPFYFDLGYTGNVSYYIDEGDNLHDHVAKCIFSYRPFENFSYGIGNYFKKVASKKIATPFGDRLLTRGYKEDTPVFEVKWQPRDKLSVEYSWLHYWLDADSSADDFIDRGDNSARIAFDYEFWNDFIGTVGYRYYDAHFPHRGAKDTESSRGFYGITKKFPGAFNLTVEAGNEHKKTVYQNNDSNIDARLSLNTTFSVYTIFSLNYTYNRVLPSARSEYFQYFTNSVSAGIKHIINPKTTIFVNGGVEQQDFDSADALSGQPVIDRETEIISCGASLRRKLNDYLTVNLGYEYTKRNTDFASEGYSDNKVSLGVTARY